MFGKNVYNSLAVQIPSFYKLMWIMINKRKNHSRPLNQII
ncbi:hypothetical protein HMPREF9419_0437 [Prevotella nigrescens ATCC 33563]|nr:hypothetical protein HMPREF9419_0437 [Prevotella nigrescens ATCC 33563]